MTDPSTESVAGLVGRARSGDVRAFEALYRASAGRVYALCLRMSGDRVRAQELAHDAFVRAWEQLSSFRGEASFDTWMHRLTVNHVLMALRSDRRRDARVGSMDDDDPGASDVAWVPPANIDARLDLEDAIGRLPPTARQVFVLHDVEGYKHEEIAERLAVASGTVRAHLHRARQLLMRYLSR